MGSCNNDHSENNKEPLKILSKLINDFITSCWKICMPISHNLYDYITALLQMGHFFHPKGIDICLIFPWKHMLYSLEAPRWGASNEYPQHMFLWRNKTKNIYLDSYLVLWITLYVGSWVCVLFQVHMMLENGRWCYYPNGEDPDPCLIRVFFSVCWLFVSFRFMSLSTIIHSYHDVVWMSQGAQCLLLEYCLTEISCSRHMN